MHILAILFVLSALVLTFGVIAVMLMGHSQRIITALLGDASRGVPSMTFQPKSARSRRVQPVSAAAIRALRPHPLAA